MNTQNFSISFAPTLDGVDGELPSRFMGTAYSGGVIPGYGFFGDVAIDLSTMKMPTKPVFALLNHDTNQRAGKCEVLNAGSLIEVSGSFSKATSAGRQVAAEFSEGAPWEFSVGINAEFDPFKKLTAVDVNGQSLMVNGIFRNASVREVSFVPAGADPNTKAVAFEAQTSFTLESPMSDDIKDKLDSVTSLNADLQLKLSAIQADHIQVIEDLTAKLADEVLQSKALFERANLLEAELKSFKESVRLKSVKALFADLNKDYSEAAGLVYQSMSDEAFAAVAADLRSMKPVNFSASLFQETAVNGKEGATEVSLAAQLFNQVAGVK
jgi:hypothetical protein